MRKLFFVIFLVYLSFIFGCSKTNSIKMYQLVKDFRFSEDMTYEIIDLEETVFLCTDYRLCQSFLELLYDDIALTKTNSNERTLNAGSTAVRITVKDGESIATILVYDDGTVFVRVNDDAYTTKSKVVDYKKFAVACQIRNVYTCSSYHYNSYYASGAGLANFSKYEKNGIVEYKKLTKKQIENSLQLAVEELKEYNATIDNNEDICNNSSIASLIVNYRAVLLDQAVEELLNKDIDVVLIPYSYFGANKRLIWNQWPTPDAWDIYFVQSSADDDVSVYLYGNNQGGYIYNKATQKIYIVSKNDMPLIINYYDNALLEIEEEINELKQEIIGWWAS